MPRVKTGTEILKATCEVKNGFVDIKCRIENLEAEKEKTPKKGEKPNHPKAKNADIQEPKFHEWGFWVKITGNQKGKLENEVYIPCIVKLHFEIVPSDCYCTAEDHFIHVFVKKKDIDQSWDYDIRNTNLETASKTEIEAFMRAAGCPAAVETQGDAASI